MDVHTSHLAAALLAGPGMYKSAADLQQSASQDDIKPEKEVNVDPQEEEKEEPQSNDEYTDEESEAQSNNKSTPGRGVTLQMLLDAKVLLPGLAAMTIEYLGQKFVGDLQADGKIKSHETETIFCSPSAWAIHCKRIINPDKRSGCGWASVKYKGKKLDTIKATWLRRIQLQRDTIPTDDELEMEIESQPEPPPQRIVVKHNTVPNRMIQHDSNTLVEAVSFSSVGKVQPFLVSIGTNASLVLDLHCHLKMTELCGYLAGSWDVNTHNVSVTHSFPCLTSKSDPKPTVLVEAEVQMEIEKLGLTLVGWYHSHPTNPAMPSLRDCDSQLDYQIRMRGPTEITYTPCIGIICSPYNPESPVLESSLTCFWVTPPPEQRPTEYPRPLLMQYTIQHDSHLTSHAMEQIKKSIKYYLALDDESCIKFETNYKPDISYLDKLKCTLTPKFPREQSDGLLWHFIKDALGCSTENDDKIDLDALLAVPQQIPITKPSQQTIIPNIPSVSTLQQMVSRPAGIPPMNVSSSLGSLSLHKFEMPTQLNIPVPQVSTKTSKSSSSTSNSYPSGLDVLTSMAMGLGGSNMSMPLSGSGLDSLTANNLLSGLPPGISTSLAATLTGAKLPDPPSYASSLHNLSSSLNNFEKTVTSGSSSVSSSSPSLNSNIPASLASNLMMSSADIANALFSSNKFSTSASLLGIPDPMSKSTLAANNMFLSPSLLKMQESLLKPLSSSSPLSSKSSLDQNLLMKSPQDHLKSSKDYMSSDFNLSSLKSKVNFPLPSVSPNKSDGGYSKVDSLKNSDLISDFTTSKSSESFLSQMLELTKKTTKNDYGSDYSAALKSLKAEDYSSSLNLSSQSPYNYSTHSNIADTIAQVAMGNLPAPKTMLEEQSDYGCEQDLSMPKDLSNDNERME